MRKGAIILTVLLCLMACAFGFGACAQNPQGREENEEREIQLSAPDNFTLKGAVLSWDEVENADYYVLRGDGEERNLMANSYTFSDIGQSRQVVVSVRAVSFNKLYLKSEWAQYTYVYVKEEPPTEALKYTLLEDGSGYEVARANVDINQGLEGKVVIPDYYNGLPVKKIADKAFSLPLSNLGNNTQTGKGCNTVTTKIKLPACLQEIGPEAFQYCTALKEIEIPDTVTVIGDDAFYRCIRLNKVTLSSSVKEIGFAAFYATAVTEIAIPESVNKIGDKAFQKCENLSRISFASDSGNIKDFGVYVFEGTAWYNGQPDGLVALNGDILYSYKGEMAEGTVIDELPSGIKYIAGGAFRNYRQLASINLTGVKLLGNAIFFGCSALTDVTISGDMTELPDITFSNCRSLVSVKISGNVTQIADLAFGGCEKLTEIVLPSTIKNIGAAFSGCASLSKVYFGGTQEQWEEIETVDKVIQQATKYFYSETQPADDGNYWHYVDGNPVIWE